MSELDSLLEPELRPRLEQLRRIAEAGVGGREIPLVAPELARVTSRLRSRSVSRSDHMMTSSALVPTRVYWYCARLARVLIWMSCTGWK